MVVIANRTPALLSVNNDAALRSGQRTKTACTIAQKREPPASIILGDLRRGFEKVLGQDDVIMAVSVKVRDAHPESRAELRFNGKRPGRETLAMIEKHHAFQATDF